MEEWKSILGYEGLYEVSNYGNVASLNFHSTGKRGLLKLGYNGRYYGVVLCKNLTYKRLLVHRLVMQTFVGASSLNVDHIDGDGLNNHLSNLRYCTLRQNLSFDNRRDIDKLSSRYTGVSFRKDRKRWLSSIRVNQKFIYIGLFKTELEAHLAYQQKLKQIV